MLVLSELSRSPLWWHFQDVHGADTAAQCRLRLNSHQPVWVSCFIPTGRLLQVSFFLGPGLNSVEPLGDT